MSAYSSFALGLVLGILGFALVQTYKGYRKRPNRIVPVGAMRRRTQADQALAFAFAKLYENYADPEFSHFVTDEDKKHLHSIVRGFLRDKRDKLGEMHLGCSPFERGEEEIAERVVAKAEELFLQV